MQEIFLEDVNHYSENNFKKYADYHEAKKIAQQAGPYLSYAQKIEVDRQSLFPGEEERWRRKVLNIRRLLNAEENFILRGIMFPFHIHYENGSPFTILSNNVFQDGPMLENIIQNDWHSFGRSTLKVERIYADQSYIQFYHPQFTHAQLEPFTKSPALNAILKCVIEGIEPWKNFKEENFKDPDKSGASVAGRRLVEKGLDPTNATMIAKWFKQATE